MDDPYLLKIRNELALFAADMAYFDGEKLRARVERQYGRLQSIGGHQAAAEFADAIVAAMKTITRITPA